MVAGHTALMRMKYVLNANINLQSVAGSSLMEQASWNSAVRMDPYEFLSPKHPVRALLVRIPRVFRSHKHHEIALFVRIRMDSQAHSTPQ